MGRFADYHTPGLAGKLKTKKDLNSRKKAERTKFKQAKEEALKRNRAWWGR